MNTVEKNIFILFILAIPFTSAFAISGTINLPIISGIALFIFCLLSIVQTKKISLNFFCYETKIIILFLFFVLLSYAINGIPYSFSLNHTLAYFSSFIFFLLTPLFFFLNNKTPQQLFRLTLKWIFISVLTSSVFSLVEFTLTNFCGITVSDLIPRVSVKEYDPFIVGFLIRSRGFAEESGHYGFMIEIFAPLCAYYLYKSGFFIKGIFYKNISMLCIVLSILTSFSVASFLLIPACIIISLTLGYKPTIEFIRNHHKKILVTIILLLFVWQIINLFIPLTEIVQITIEEKFDSFSFEDRAFRSNFFWQTFPKLPLINILFGVGPSGFRILGHDDSFSFLSLYQTITFEIGIVGLMCFGSFLLSLFIKLMTIKHNIKFFLIISFLCGIIHYNSISNYWYPWFWFLCCFILFYYYSFKNVVSEN